MKSDNNKYYPPVLGSQTDENTVNAEIEPIGFMETLSRAEQQKLLDRSNSGLHQVFKNCCLAVLNCGGNEDHYRSLTEKYPDFDVSVVQRERGIKLIVKNAPSSAFVDGVLIRGIQENLYAVLRDILFTSSEIESIPNIDDISPQETTDMVFRFLRHAGALNPGIDPNMVVCWGGHSIKEHEYVYTKKVGYELGLRDMDICTGCGPGAMKGPMKGASIGHSKQRGSAGGRYYGFTEPGIIAAESPNPIVNRLLILPDIEKRLEAFVRIGHGIIVFPGGAGTAVEILYILGVLLDPKNKDQNLPLIFTGPKESEAYFTHIDAFIRSTLGDQAASLYKIIIDDPEAVALEMKEGFKRVRNFRKGISDAYYFNWAINIDALWQHPFIPTHENMANLKLRKQMPAYELAANLRRAFSGIVAGNVKRDGVLAIEQHGPFQISGDIEIMEKLDKLLEAFVQQGRMKINTKEYVPCYKVIC